MPKRGGNISLSSYDDIFATDESRAEDKQERVQEIPLSELHPFEGHPFKVLDDEDMAKTVESVKEYGVLTPAIVRFAERNHFAKREGVCLQNEVGCHQTPRTKDGFNFYAGCGEVMC